MKSIIKMTSFFVLFALMALLWRQLFYSNPHELPSALINESMPSFTLNTINNYTQLKDTEFTGKVRLLNFWATWCSACSIEHAMLMKIKTQYHIPIYGILYKDEKDEALTWLSQHGDPYVKVGDDKNGDVGIDFGVYGTPETYVINEQGKIIYRHIGAIDEATWKNILLPIIKKNS